MTIFAVGMTAILAMLHSAISSSTRSREEIIAANLLREQVELIKNVRNTNIRSFAPWDRIVASPDMTVLDSAILLVENNYTSNIATYNSIEKSPVSISKVIFTDRSATADATKFAAARLYLDAK
jgi:Tfp pilus assembly protein PilV